MGCKKLNLAPHSKPLSLATTSRLPESSGGGELFQSDPSAVELEETSHSTVKQECEHALAAYKRGEHTQALRLIKAARQRNENYALVHRCEATICVSVAGFIDDENAKQRYMKSGIDSARRACSLSPNSVQFAHFYASLLYEAAQEGREYEEVVQQCERALAIENPTDPSKESFQEEQQNTTTAEARIASVQEELNSLIQKASNSTRIKNSGNEIGEEKFRLIPVSAVASELNSGGGGGSSNLSCEQINYWRSELKNQVISFWNSMSHQDKTDFLRIKTDDVKAHFGSIEYDFGLGLLSEALSYGILKRKWKFWVCCRCGQKFADGKSHVNHVVQDHTMNPMPERQKALTSGVDNKWIGLLLSCPWQPLDLNKTIRMLESPLKSEKAEYGGNVTWPLSGDEECAMLLKKISHMLQVLIRHKCLSDNLLQKVIQFSMHRLQGLAPGSPLLICGIDQTPQCICFLDAAQLRKIIKLLQEVLEACGVDKLVLNDTSIPDELLELQDKLVLSKDASYLLLDRSLLSNDDIVGEVDPTSESLLFWIFLGPSPWEQLALWSNTKQERKQQATVLLQLLEKEFGRFQAFCESKREHLGYVESLKRLEKLYIQERSKRDHIVDFTCSGYGSVLRIRKEELLDRDSDMINKFELEAISNILKEAEIIKASQYVNKEPYAGVNSYQGCIESGEDDCKSKDSLNFTDTCIQIATQRQIEQLSIELSKIDARIMGVASSIQHLKHKIETVSAFNYCSILLPLVKSFLQVLLEDRAIKDATEKSDVGRESILSERDSKKNDRGTDHSKKTHNKLKDEKRNRGLRKTKDT